MGNRTKKLILVGMLLVFGLGFIMIGAKCTPQWIEVQNLSRTNYLVFSFGMLMMGFLLLITPIKWMIRGITTELESSAESEVKR